jgi:alkylation response protein AidB-like acyl-CoA dehydrogenase
MSQDLFALPEQHRELQESIRRLVADRIAPNAAEADESGEFPHKSYAALVDSDMHALHLPEAYGGPGADQLASIVVMEEVSRGCTATSLALGTIALGTLPILFAGSEQLKQTYLRRVAEHGAIFSYGLSEPDAGSDVASMRTRAALDGDHWVLNGTKRWITNAGLSELYTVFAVTDPSAGSRGISAFVLEKGDPGMSFGPHERKMGVRGSPTAEIYLENARIPADRLIGEPGQGMTLAMRTLNHTRVAIAAQAVGIAQSALDLAVGYVQQRKQFGQAIAEFQGVQFMLAEMAMKLEAARQLTYVAACRSEREDADLPFFGAAAKCFASDTAMAVTTDAVQLLGGSGYVKDFPAERLMRDAKLTQIYEGTNQIQRIVMARHLLGRLAG